MLRVKNRTVVVVGGGSVGLRKARTLLEAGAKVRLISHSPAEMEPQPSLDIKVTDYAPELLAGADLVFACTDNRLLNARIARDARAIGAWVNAADQPEDCDFFMPAVASRGPVILAVGTGGEAPALAAVLREKLQAHLPEKIGEFARLMGRIRMELREIISDDSRRSGVLKALASEEVYHDFASRGEEGVRLHLARLLE